MRVLCRHGHLAFYPRTAADVIKFCDFFGVELQRVDDYYTFEPLAELERYSLTGKLYGTLPALTTYEGRAPWEVMRENGFVYHLETEALLAKESVFVKINPPFVGDFFLAETPLIQPGSRNAAGQQILSYSGEFVDGLFQLRVTEFGYE